jgi:predicted enzyme related to lactoylglutathione lyase
MKESMTRATGVGGVFLRAADPEKLHAWYEEHLGIKRTEDGAFAFFSEGPREMTVFAFFPLDTKYFGPTDQRAMLNLRVDDLDAVLAKLRAAAVDIDPKQEDYDYGRFAWFNDPEGNRVELWQPPGLADA